MAKLIGIVSKVIGEVFAVASDGTRRALVEGDRLFAGEQLQTGVSGAIAVHLQNGAELTLGRDSSLQLSQELLANRAPHVDAPETLTPSEAQLTDVAKIQQAIAAGGDPTQDAEATAAGPNAGVPGVLGGGHSFVLLTEVGGHVDPVIGFPTAGFNGFPELRDLDLRNLFTDNNTPPLQPPPNNLVSLNGLAVEGGEVNLNEANLPLGSAADPAALTANGTFSVIAPDGVFNLNVGGLNVVTAGVVTGVGQSIITGLGNTLTITGYNAATGVVSYSYTLNGAEQHPAGGGTNSLSESIAVTASDTDGDVANGSLDINVRDDVPQAINDTNAVTATEQHLTLTGNVLTNDVQGADRVPSGPITAGTFSGTYGTLVLAADGSYTYTLNAEGQNFVNLHGGGNGTETFTYTLTDADGDSSTANLVLNISNINDPVTLGGLGVNGGELSVFEKNLSLGSSPDTAALTQNGSFTVTAPDGLQTLSVGGISIISGGVASGFPQSVTTGLGNTFTVTGYNPATGVVSYSYTLVGNDAHPAGNGANDLNESFTVTATDTDGSTATGSIDVNVVDDTPTAVADTNATTATEQHLTLTGNVLTNDVQGADRVASGPITAGTFSGTYGTLVLAADGSYTYTLNPAGQAFFDLHGGGNGIDTFTYTLTDSDGDVSTANLVLNITNINDPVTLGGLEVNGGELTVFEKNLSLGSNPDTGALTQSGTFTVTAPDGLQTLTVGGINVISGGVASGFPQSVTTGLGNTFTVTGYNPATGVVSYSYTLVGNDAHPAGNGANDLNESFTVTATDTDGSSATGSIDVKVVDDTPTAVADTNATTATEQHLTLTGNVLTNDVQGADRVASGPITAGTFSGTYGTLVLAADGSYTYTLNPAGQAFFDLHGGGNGIDTFTYTLTDSDGDVSTANLVLNITNINDPVTLGGLEVNGGELTVFEKNLSLGSNPDTGALTQSGTFTVTAPDGLQTLTVGGINVISGGVASGFPQSVTTGLGNTFTVTGYNPATGVVSYSYTLVGNDAHPAGNGANDLNESFTVTATDTDGSSATGSIDVKVVDDTPTAVADTNATTATEQHLTLTGNVLTNDVQGADRVPSGPITAGTFSGTYGTLVLAADGSYTYTLNAEGQNFVNLHGGGNGTETFTYTLTDSDGDISTANLVLNITNINDPVTLGGLDVNGGELTVFEKNLSLGSSPDTGALTQSGTFTVTAPDGLQTLTVGGINIISGGVASGFPQSVTTGLGNTFTVTGYNPSTGVVSYSYTLVGNDAHPAGNGANDLNESFTVTATDTDGSSATGSIDVKVVDDTPTAVADTNATTATEQHLTLTGNVLTNDVQGADRVPTGPITAGTFSGTYGTLVLAADGSYTYTLNPAGQAFFDLHGGGNGIDTFTYTLTDSDGDVSTANLVLNITNINDPVTLGGLEVNGGELTVFEKNLSLGSNPDTGALTQSGTFTVTAPDGLQTLTVGGINVISGGVASGFPQSVTTGLGNTFTVTGYNPATGVVSYSYTLVGNDAHPAGNGANDLNESFTVTATDTDGSSATGSIDVKVVDDTPTAVADTNATTATEQHLTLTGNVLTNDVQGADRVPTGPITAGTFSGTYGTLVLAADGSYTYTLNAAGQNFINLHGGGNGTETFTYTLTDSDGDISTANLVLNITNINDPVTLGGLDVNGGELTVFEKNLSLGSSPDTGALTQSGTFTVTAPDGLQTLTVGGINIVSGGVASGFPQSVTTGLGNTFTVTGYNPATGVVSYSYTLVGNDAHPAGNGANDLNESFTVTATDTDGSTATGSIDVKVVDDTPTAVADTNATTATEQHLTLTGNVLTNDVQGADRVASGPITAGTFSGTYGTLVLAADGSYTYTLNPAGQAFFDLHGGGNGIDTFTYTLTDSDGDVSTANLVLNITNINDPVTLGGLEVNGGELTVFEKNLSLGSNPDTGALTQSGTFTVTAPDGLQTLTVGGINVISGGVASGFPQSVTTGLGNTFTVTGYNPATGVVSYSYTLVGNDAHPAGNGANNLNESFTVTATDTDGSSATGSIDVKVVDDTPTAVADTNATTATEQHLTLTGNVLTNDVQGADRVASGPITAGTFSGTYGTLVLAADGSYTYTLNAAGQNFVNLHGGGNGTETFTYTLTDSDGDVSTANLVLNITNINDPVTLGGLDVTGGELIVYEKNLGDGSSPNPGALTQTGTFTVTAPDGLQTLTVGGISVVSGGVTSGLPHPITTLLGNTLTVTSYNASTGVVTYTYTLVDNESHPTGNGINNLTESFTVNATDSDGSTASGSLDVTIVDDVPTARPDSASLLEGATTTLNVLTNDTKGADDPGNNAVVGVRAGSFSSASGSVGVSVAGVFGTLVLDAAGNASYHANPNSVSPAGAQDVFTYTIRDSDGDESTTTLTFNVQDSSPVATPDNDVTVYEKALDLVKDGQDLAAGTVTGSDPGSTGETASGTLVGSVTGGSGGLTYSLVSNAVGSFGQIQLNANGTYTYTLTSAPKTPGSPNNGADTQTELFTYKATDALGNTSTSTIVINIVDDVPKAADAQRSVTPGQVDSNLLLVIDVSGSMNDASGVPGLTRIQLAKQAISALLDKYDEMGDVKVQLVTFSTGANQQSAVWVTVDQAKAIVNGLTAGGSTYYDSAITSAQSAYTTNGKITGAQNIVYFFSDGAPTSGHAITAPREAAWETFLDNNGIKSYAIGLGSGVNAGNLNPLAYDGSTHTDTNATVVTDLNQLNSVLSGTVQGAPITGSLMSGGDFGADGGFIKSLVIDGTTYTYDPKGNNGAGAYSTSGAADRGTFDTGTNSITVKTAMGGSIVVNMDTGDFTYTPPKDSGSSQVEQVGFVVSDNDGDTASANLVINVYSNSAPVAGADHVITNVLSSSITLPAEALLANDTDPNNDHLSVASTTTFNTGWTARGADFTVGSATPTIGFAGTGNTTANQLLNVARSSFTGTTGSMTAAVVISGYLGAVSTANANDEDQITVTLKQGETLTLDHNRSVTDNVLMEWKDAGGTYQAIADGGSFTASHDGVYTIHLVNQTNLSGSGANNAESYQLNMSINYAGAQDNTPQYNGTYTVSDGHGGSSAGAVDINYQAGNTLTGTSHDDTLIAANTATTLNGGDGNDVLVGGNGDDILHGGNGNDLLIGGLGNDLLDGGAGIDTASYASAPSAVTVNLNLTGPQNTGGGGTDTLVSIENLIGSDYNDTLIGDNNANVLVGGKGDDTLVGGGGDDTLIGGPGNNTLTGGTGADTFLYQQGNTGHDVVTDFTPGTDHLDLSQLLQGENATSASLDDYLHFKVTGSGASVVSTIEVSSVAGATPTQTIDLAGVDLAQHYGVTAGAGGVIAAGHDTATIINGMLNDHSLKVDTV